MTWLDRALCRRRPADWWDLGDDGNRLAMTLCAVACPVRVECHAHDPRPAGVVRAAVAYRDTGEVAPLCGCGRPVVRRRPTTGACLVCEPRMDTPMPARRPGRKAAAGDVERHADLIAELIGDGWTYRAVGLRIGATAEAVRGVCRRYGLPSLVTQAGPRRPKEAAA